MNDWWERIKANNPWWGYSEAIKNDTLILEFENQRYRYFHPLLKTLSTNQDGVLTLRGPRRVGKSTLVRLIVKRLLLEKNIPKEAVFFFPCDRVEDYNQLFELLKTYLEFARPKTRHRLFIFLDEISFIKDWQRGIKELADQGWLKNALCLLTGSSLLDLKFGSEFLAGRRGKISPADIFFYPLSFKDFVKLVAPSINLANPPETLFYELPHINKLFYDYLLVGGFPLTINEFYASGRLSNSIYETFFTWIENDLHKTRRNEKTADDLLENVIRTLTTPVSFVSLAKSISLASHLAVAEYLEILEKMFVLFSLNAYLIDQKKRDLKKNKKIYFTDPFIFNCLFLKTRSLQGDHFLQSQGSLAPAIMPLLAENIVGLHLKRLYPALYWGKTAKNEIDFVGCQQGKDAYFEVKYREKIDYSEVQALPDLEIISKKTFSVQPVKTTPLVLHLLSALY